MGLCQEFGLRWWAGAAPRDKAQATPNDIWTPPLDGIPQYYLTLHEIAHVVLRHTVSWRPIVIEAEGEAWLWAMENAIVQPNVPTLRWIAHYLAEYRLVVRYDRRYSPPPEGGWYYKALDTLHELWVPTQVY